ncbi:hypothetical protein NVP1015O_51 [Vibrio phage 1.015.O._10N.222.51.E5]|nr:hypothetical protein NVP1015O_51 [Vibrio phage 1.015.O._10N.222.51.E5]
MSHGVASTAGHLASNGGIRGHSAGDSFPMLVVGKGNPFDGSFRWQVRTPKGVVVGSFCNSHNAERHALVWKGVL